MITFQEMIATKGLKDPTGKAKPMRVTLAMVQKCGEDRSYPSALFDRTVQNGLEGVEIDADSTWTTGEYVAEFCKLNHLKATS
jgi:hypothetical protein